MQLLHILASGGGGAKNLWDPTILGVLTVLAGVVLFCGSTYMLLATNVGARQGFLISFTALTGITFMLGMLWVTTATPLNVPKGRVGEWQTVSDDPAKAILSDLASSDIAAIRTIQDEGTVVPLKADDPPKGVAKAAERAELRPAVEAALVTPKPEGPEAVVAGPLNQFSEASDVVTELESLEAYVIGGGTKNLFWTHHRYAAIQFCEKFSRDRVFDDPDNPVTEPECDPNKDVQWLILERDFGSLRLPNYFYAGVSGLLFALGLYAMHIKERSDQAAAALVPASA